MGDVVKLELIEIGEKFRLDVDEMLEKTKGNQFTIIAILGELEDGSFFVSGNANAGETIILMEKAKRHIVWGE